jgi:hypothetical protein
VHPDVGVFNEQREPIPASAESVCRWRSCAGKQYGVIDAWAEHLRGRGDDQAVSKVSRIEKARTTVPCSDGSDLLDVRNINVEAADTGQRLGGIIDQPRPAVSRSDRIRITTLTTITAWPGRDHVQVLLVRVSEAPSSAHSRGH